MDGDLDAATLVGLLADDDRRRVAAAVELGARHLADVEAATDLDTVRTAKALGRLVDAGLVIELDGGLHLVGAAFQRAAREALSRPRTSEHGDAPDEVRKVLDAFVRDGRIVQVPAARGKRLVLLDWLVQDFEVGRRYSEPMVNLVIGRRHADTAMWRRYLVDEDMLSREAGEYWRSGGSVAIGPTT